mmetsp:Transcript_31780/g.60700  ORF Transcript_31780/g.60700 Transcript_31780/m.60700 type:complete len:428 (+) Transcript_31780:174-1457(+)
MLTWSHFILLTIQPPYLYPSGCRDLWRSLPRTRQKPGQHHRNRRGGRAILLDHARSRHQILRRRGQSRRSRRLQGRHGRQGVLPLRHPGLSHRSHRTHGRGGRHDSRRPRLPGRDGEPKAAFARCAIGGEGIGGGRAIGVDRRADGAVGRRGSGGHGRREEVRVGRGRRGEGRGDFHFGWVLEGGRGCRERERGGVGFGQVVLLPGGGRSGCRSGHHFVRGGRARHQRRAGLRRIRPPFGSHLGGFDIGRKRRGMPSGLRSTKGRGAQPLHDPRPQRRPPRGAGRGMRPARESVQRRKTAVRLQPQEGHDGRPVEGRGGVREGRHRSIPPRYCGGHAAGRCQGPSRRARLVRRGVPRSGPGGEGGRRLVRRILRRDARFEHGRRRGVRAHGGDGGGQGHPEDHGVDSRRGQEGRGGGREIRRQDRGP